MLSPARSRLDAARTICLVITCVSACVEHFDPVAGGDSSSTGEMTTSESSEAASGSTVPDDGASAGMTDSAEPGEGSDSAGMPACMGACAEIPAGWVGPVVIAEGASDEPTRACAGAFGAHAFARYADFRAPAAECGCSCGEALGTSCPDASLIQTSAHCLVSEDTITLEQGCNDVPNVAGEDWRVSVPAPQGGACAAEATAVVPPVGLGRHIVACGPTHGATRGCGADETCVPASDDGAPWCVWAEGEMACPDGFPARQFAFGDVDDTRGCTQCSCGEPEGDCDMGAVFLTGLDNACGVIQGSPFLALDAGECGHFGGNLLSVDVSQAPMPDVACEPSIVQPTGSVIATDTVTVCCSA